MDRSTFAAAVVANGKVIDSLFGGSAVSGLTLSPAVEESSLHSAYGVYTPIEVTSYTVLEDSDAHLERNQ